jgi:hypothetical protein
MGCACRNKTVQAKKIITPRVPAKVFQNPIPQPDLPGPLENHTLSEQDAMTTERRRIEKLRREAVRRSLGIG